MTGMRVKRVAALWLAVLTTCLWAPGPAVLARSLDEPTDTESQPLSAPMVYDDQEKTEEDTPPPDDEEPEEPEGNFPGDEDGQPDGAEDDGEHPGEGEAEKESPEQPDSEGSVSDSDGAVVEGLEYDPQPEAPLDAEELERLLEEEKLPRWEFAVDEEWIPQGWRQVERTWAESGPAYWTVEPAGPVAARAPFAINDWTTLKQAIENATDGEVITIDVDIDGPSGNAAANVIEIKTNITIQSAVEGDPVRLTVGGAYRHFLISSACRVTFRDVILDGDKTGGGIQVGNVGSGGAVSISGAELENCRACNNTGTNNSLAYNTGYGGAIYVHNPGEFTLEDTVIRDSSATYGGGLYVRACPKVNIQGVDIQECEANYPNGARGGGIGIYHTSTGANTTAVPSTVIVDSNVQGNSSLDTGGGLAVFGHLSISGNTTITDNTAKEGAGIYMNTAGANLLLEGVVVQDNNASTNGGGIYSAGNITVGESSRIEGNQANVGGGIYGASTSSSHLVTIAGGSVIHNNTARSTLGGGVYTLTPIVVSGSTISSNTAGTLGNAAAGGGGGIYGTQNITIQERSHILDNKAKNYGGGIYSPTSSVYTVSISNSSVRQNRALTTAGGGVHTQAILTIDHSDISENIAQTIGGGVYAPGNGPVQITDSKVNDNHSLAGNGGGIYASAPLTVSGGEISENTAVAGGGIYGSGDISIDNGCDIWGNEAGNGGGVYAPTSNASPLQISDSSIRNNTATANAGGGIYTQIPVVIDHTVIGENTAQTQGGGVHGADNITVQNQSDIWGNSALNGNGGGIYAGLSTSTLQITGNTRIRENTAGKLGGGIYANGTIQLTDAGLEKNKADSGGGLAVVSPGSVSAQNSRFTENQAAASGGAIYTDSLDDVTLQNVELANNVVPEGYAIVLSPGLSSTHNSKIIDTQYTYPFQNAYNNGDISNGSGSGSIAVEPGAQSKKHIGIYIEFHEDDLTGPFLDRMEYKTYAGASPEYLLDNDPDLSAADWLSHYRPSPDHSVTRYYVDTPSGWVETDRLPAVVEADTDTLLAVLYAVDNSTGNNGGGSTGGSGGGSTSTPPPTTTGPEESGGEEEGGEEEGGEEETPDEETPPEEQEEQQAAVGGSQSGGGSGGRGGSGSDRSDDGSPNDDDEEDADPDAEDADTVNGANGAAKGTGAIVVDPTSAIPLLEQELPLVAFVNAIGVDSGTTVVIEASQNTSGGQLWIRLGSIAMFGTPACWILGFFIKRHKNKKRDVLPED